MFFSKKNGVSQLISDAKEILKSAKRVVNFRKDLIAASDLCQINQHCSNISQSIKARDFNSVEVEISELKNLLLKHGADIYPLTGIADNADLFIVASVVALVFRTFFFQPFQIPTNSMYPTYYGMTARVYLDNESRPNIATRLKGAVLQGADNFQILSEYDGEIVVPLYIIDRAKSKFCAYYEIADTRKWFGLFPSKSRVYRLVIGGMSQKIYVPADFSIDEVFLRKFTKQDTWTDAIHENSDKFIYDESGKILWFRTGQFVKRGDFALIFDILAGDMLFVDKISYHFRDPRVGESVVFRTDNIKMMRNDPKYYIKRYVGAQGDVLRVINGSLLRNGEDIFGCDVFDMQKNKIGKYCGYVADGDLEYGNEVRVLNDEMYMMGDNSANSYDSRFWGGVPKKSAAGKPMFIFYPFTNRWGVAK